MWTTSSLASHDFWCLEPPIAWWSWYSFYRPTEGRRLSWPSWLVTYRDGLPVHRWSPILVLTGSDVPQLHWSRPKRYDEVCIFWVFSCSASARNCGGFTQWWCLSVICLFEIVQGFATWQHLVASGGGTYHVDSDTLVITVVTTPLPPVGHIWDVMLVWRKGILTELSLFYSIVYYYNGAQRYELFLQVGRLYRALILLGLALSSERLCVFGLHGATHMFIKKFCLHSCLYLILRWAWCYGPLTWLTNRRPSVLWHCWLGHLTRKVVSEMTYNVSSGTLNSTILYWQQFSSTGIVKRLTLR